MYVYTGCNTNVISNTSMVCWELQIERFFLINLSPQMYRVRDTEDK